MTLMGAGIYLLQSRTNRFYYYTKKTGLADFMHNLIHAMRGYDFQKLSRKYKVEKEIYEGTSFMRNILTLNAGKEVRADVLIEKLADKNGVLQPVYAKMLGLLRVNRAGDALQTFIKGCDCQASAKEYGSILVKWDELNPDELGEILISIQKAAREKRVTEQKKKDEIVSDLIYLPVVLNVLIIFVNFLYVAFFLNQQEMLMQLF